MNATTATKTTAVTQPKFPPMDNGDYLKGKFCGIHRRERTNDDGTFNITYSLVFETDLISNKRWVTLTKKHIKDGFHERFTDEYIGRTMIVPVFNTVPNVYNGKAYQTTYYQGDKSPYFVD